MIWAAFSENQKSELSFMPKGLPKAIDFVEFVYDGELIQFMDKIPRRILMEDGAYVDCSKLPEQWRQTRMIEKFVWPPNSYDVSHGKYIENTQRYRSKPRTTRLNFSQKFEEIAENFENGVEVV